MGLFDALLGAGLKSAFTSDKAKSEFEAYKNSQSSSSSSSGSSSSYSNSPSYNSTPSYSSSSSSSASSSKPAPGIYQQPTDSGLDFIKSIFNAYKPDVTKAVDKITSPLTGLADAFTGAFGSLPQAAQYAAEQQAGESNTDKLLRELMTMMAAMGDKNNEMWKAQMEAAQQQAARAAEERKQSYGNLITSLGHGQDSELEQLNAKLSGTKQDLEDRSFQDYLAARQGMANRGLAGSGLASDQDTRLLLGQGRELARINQDAMGKANEITRRYGDKLTEAQQQLAGVSQSDLEMQYFNELYKTGSQQLTDRAKLMTDLIGKTIGYDYVNAGDAERLKFDYTKLATQDRQFYDQLSSNEKVAYAKMDSEERQLMAKLDSEERMAVVKLKQDYEIRMTEIMGVDYAGRPTLNTQKLYEQIRSNIARQSETSSHNAALEAQGWAKISQSNEELQYKVAALNQKADEAAAKLQQSQVGQQVGVLKTTLNERGSQVSNLQKSLSTMSKSSSAYKETFALYKQAVTEYEAAFDALNRSVDLVGLSSGGGKKYYTPEDYLKNAYSGGSSARD